MEINSYEYSVAQKREGKWIIYKLALVLAYLAYVAAYFAVIIRTGFVPLGALIPVTLWIIVFFTWRYTSPDYKYAVRSGMLSFTICYGGRSEKLAFEAHIADATAIVPLCEAKEALARAKRRYSALPCSGAADAYAFLFEKDGKSCVFIFKATRDALKILHFYNDKTKITPTEL